MSLPKVLYVGEHRDAQGTTFLVADRNVAEVIEDDGPTTVGTYRLIQAGKMVKETKEAR